MPGSPLLPSTKVGEQKLAFSRPLGTTGLFRGVSGRTRRSFLVNLNLRLSGEIERAIGQGDLMALHAALNRGSETGGLSVSKDGYVRTKTPRALHLAALFGDVRMAHALIIAGSDIHATIPQLELPGRRLFSLQAIRETETSLHLAMGSRQAPMIEFLLSQRALLYDSRFNLDLPTTNLLDFDWLRATRCSSAQEVVDVLQVLINAGWDLNRPLGLRRPGGDSIMHRLLSKPNWPIERKSVLSFCLNSGFKIDRKGYNGKTIRETALQLNDDQAWAIFFGHDAVPEQQLAWETI